jgi:hypothetical protein
MDRLTWNLIEFLSQFPPTHSVKRNILKWEVEKCLFVYLLIEAKGVSLPLFCEHQGMMATTGACTSA